MRKQTKLNINLKEYNNKSRKGLYISIKQEGKPQRLYKYHGNYGEIDATKKYYEDRYIKKKPLAKSQRTYRQAYQKTIEKAPKEKPTQKTRTIIRIRKHAEQHIKKIRKGKTIDSYVKTGTAKIKITKANQQSPSTIHNKIKQLLSQLIIDKNIIEIMSQNENLEKIKHRLEYKIEILNEQGQKLMEFNKFNTTPAKAITELKQSIDENEEVNNKKTQGETANNLKNMKWHESGNYNTQGKITNTNLTITLRK